MICTVAEVVRILTKVVCYVRQFEQFERLLSFITTDCYAIV